MKTFLRFLLALLAFGPAALFAGENPAAGSAKNCGCACCQGKDTCCCHEEASTPVADDAKRHPLKGVIVDILADQSALLVKHEAIPGYMMAMTMLFKVDAPTLKSANKGQAITATLVERADGYWLEDVKPVTPERR